MASFQKIYSFVEAVMEKVHNFGADSFVIALCATANAPTTATTKKGDLTEISYTNLSSRAITTSSSAQSSGTYKWVAADVTLSASGGAVAAWQYAFIYNDTATNDEGVGFYDYGSALTLGNGESVLIDFDGTNGVLQLS